MADREAEMRLMLRALRLPAVAGQYQDLAIKAAKANMTHESYLYELVRAECLQREEHRVVRLQRLSGLPPDKTFLSCGRETWYQQSELGRGGLTPPLISNSAAAAISQRWSLDSFLNGTQVSSLKGTQVPGNGQ